MSRPDHILIGRLLRLEASHWSIIVTWPRPHLCQQVYHEEQGAAWIWDTAAWPGQSRTGRSYRLQAVTSCHAPRRLAVSGLATSSCPDNCPTHHAISGLCLCSPQLKASYLQSFQMTQFLEISNVDSLCRAALRSPRHRRAGSLIGMHIF